MAIALCDHPEIHEILAGLHRMGYGISPASLRLDDLTEPIVRILRASGERTLTIAPETGSDRLRRVINKGVTNDEILERADLIFACGIENLKLYYLVGIPTETDEDLLAIRDLTIRIRDRLVARARPRGAIGRIAVSVNPLVPKPGTPFQWLPMEGTRVTNAKIRRLRSLLAGIDNVTLSAMSERHARFQALLALGDRRVASRHRGCRAQRRRLAQGGRRRRHRPGVLPRTRSARRPRAAVGCHRRHPDGGVPPRRVREKRARGDRGRRRVCRRPAREPHSGMAACCSCSS